MENKDWKDDSKAIGFAILVAFCTECAVWGVELLKEAYQKRKEEREAIQSVLGAIYQQQEEEKKDE